MQKIMKFLGVEKSKKWGLKFLAALPAPILIVWLQPFGLDQRQSLLVAALLLTLVWWSAGIVAKIPASIFLLLSFVSLEAAPLRTVFSFPLSETFFQIILTYIFSRGIVNSGLIEKLIEPRLFRWCKTPVKVMAAIVILYILTIYIIPQPLARLIIITNIMDAFLKETDLPEESRAVLMFTGFTFYTVVNIGLLDADIIMNSAAVAFGGQNISNLQWAKYMLVPSAVYGGLIFGLHILLFKKQLWGLKVKSKSDFHPARQLSGKEKLVMAVIGITVLFWMTSAVHGISPVLVTAIGTAVLFLMQVIKPKDFLAVDVSTLIFLTAAFSIGGAMKGSGVADKIFGQIHFIFPSDFGITYLLVITLVAMIMHMILGSNVTTLSVVTPGLLVLSEGLMSGQMLVYILIVAVSFHAILPFHNVSIMIGSSKGYYPSSYVSKLGLAVTPLVFLAIAGIYYPWWRLLGLK